jgi:hypothetical protein
MANPSKLTLYIAAITAGGGVRTLVKPKLVVSGSQIKDLLDEEASGLMLQVYLDNKVQKFAGSVRMPASLEVATSQLIYFVAPIVSTLKMYNRKCAVEVMFNDPAINTVVKNNYLDKWRANEFSYKYVNKKKETISYAAKWATFDSVLRNLNGTITCNHDDVLRDMVGELKTLRRKNNVANDFSSGG